MSTKKRINQKLFYSSLTATMLLSGSIFVSTAVNAIDVPGTGILDTPPAAYPTMEDPNLQVSTLYDDPGSTGTNPGSANNLVTPISLDFLNKSKDNDDKYNKSLVKYDMLVIEKNTGKVRHIVVLKDGSLKNFGTNSAPDTAPVVLDLAVNNASERGLLGIAIHPNNKKVYLFFTERTDPNPNYDPAKPESNTNPKFIRNTPNADNSDDISNTIITGSEIPALGEDTSFPPPANSVISPQTPLLGNRVASFKWDAAANGGKGALTFDKSIIRLRSFQNDRNARVQPTPSDPVLWNRAFNANHNSGKIKFGTDGKLYIMMGDNGRRGLMQNITSPLGIDQQGNLTNTDDVFGGPAPDNAHFTGVIIRLNDDGSAPKDNPFYKSADSEAARMAMIYGLDSTKKAEVKANLQKLYGYGVRNGFGLTVDPFSGKIWDSENSAKSFEEINLINPGHNGGWAQIMGPSSRMDPHQNTIGDPAAPHNQIAGSLAAMAAECSPSGLSRGTCDLSSNYTNIVADLGDYAGIETLWGIGRSGGVGTGGAPTITQTFTGPRGMQQPRFLASANPLFPNSGTIAHSKSEAISRLYMPNAARLEDPAFSVKHVVANAGLGFIVGDKLGRQYEGDLISGSGVTFQRPSTEANTAAIAANVTPPIVLPTNGYENTPYFYPWNVNAYARPEDGGSSSNYGHIYRFQMMSSKDNGPYCDNRGRRHDDEDDRSSNYRTKFYFSDPALQDLVADNRGLDDWKQEQGSILFGRNFGVTTEILTAPDGNLVVVSLNRILAGNGQGLGQQSSTGRIYVISKKP